MKQRRITRRLAGALTLATLAPEEITPGTAEGDRGFLLFHGVLGADYFMPMAREGGMWRVAAIAPSAIS